MQHQPELCWTGHWRADMRILPQLHLAEGFCTPKRQAVQIRENTWPRRWQKHNSFNPFLAEAQLLQPNSLPWDSCRNTPHLWNIKVAPTSKGGVRAEWADMGCYCLISSLGNIWDKKRSCKENPNSEEGFKQFCWKLFKSRNIYFHLYLDIETCMMNNCVWVLEKQTMIERALSLSTYTPTKQGS